LHGAQLTTYTVRDLIAIALCALQIHDKEMRADEDIAGWVSVFTMPVAYRIYGPGAE
jgi:hypothetical protein